jgi:EAL domain-containing protein (putative c-di-GMP-specific phosphodiesterase class I)
MWRPDRRRSELGPLFAGAAPLDDQLRLVTQPIVDLAAGEPVAAELIALVARRPRNGSPVAGCFQAGSTGIEDIDAWVVQRAAFLAAWGERVHVALSGRSVKSDTFVFRIERAIDRAGADPRLLAFELDETFAARETGAAATLAHTLASFGCSIAIRGCGFSQPSAAHLARIPADYLKIDARIVDSVGDDPGAVETIVAIAETAAQHDLETIAESVYDEELRSLLHLAGVDYGQGFPSQRHFL